MFKYRREKENAKKGSKKFSLFLQQEFSKEMFRNEKIMTALAADLGVALEVYDSPKDLSRVYSDAEDGFFDFLLKKSHGFYEPEFSLVMINYPLIKYSHPKDVDDVVLKTVLHEMVHHISNSDFVFSRTLNPMSIIYRHDTAQSEVELVAEGAAFRVLSKIIDVPPPVYAAYREYMLSYNKRLSQQLENMKETRDAAMVRIAESSHKAESRLSSLLEV